MNMQIKKELIPSDKLKELTSKQINEIKNSLFEPIMVRVDDVALPKYVSSDLDKKDKQFNGRLLRMFNGKALFEPLPNEWEKIAFFDKVNEIYNRLFALKMLQNKLTLVNTENRETKKNEVIELFNQVFQVKSKTNTLEPNDSKTAKVIRDTFNGIDKLGWNYAFKNESDFELFVSTLTVFFEFKEYKVPSTIQLQRRCKTKLGKALGGIYKELGVGELKHNNRFFELVRCLSDFKNETEIELYKILTR